MNTIEINKENLDAVKQIVCLNDISDSDRVNCAISCLINEYSELSNSMVNYFTKLEFLYIAQAFNACIIEDYMFSSPNYLLNNLKEFHKYGSMGFITNEKFDYNKLEQKIEKLNSLGSIIIINSVIKFWEEAQKNSQYDPSNFKIVQES